MEYIEYLEHKRIKCVLSILRKKKTFKKLEILFEAVGDLKFTSFHIPIFTIKITIKIMLSQIGAPTKKSLVYLRTESQIPQNITKHDCAPSFNHINL